MIYKFLILLYLLILFIIYKLLISWELIISIIFLINTLILIYLDNKCFYQLTSSIHNESINSSISSSYTKYYLDGREKETKDVYGVITKNTYDSYGNKPSTTTKNFLDNDELTSTCTYDESN